MSFPPHNYHTRGAPKCRLPKVTTFGYTIKNVSIGSGKLMQMPRPSDPSVTRPRYNACTTRPERSLSVKQILAGEYFSRPDLAKYEQLVYRERTSASKKDSFSAAFRASDAGSARRTLAPSQSAPTLATLPAFEGASASALLPVASEALLPTHGGIGGA